MEFSCEIVWKFWTKNRFEMLIFLYVLYFVYLMSVFIIIFCFNYAKIHLFILYKQKKIRRISPTDFLVFQDLESQASASVVSSAAGASSVAASAFSAASAAAASALLLANSAIRASLTLASASNLSF